jgi:ubiquinone/menaquinone biosynthesis C-methylase UbiE
MRWSARETVAGFAQSPPNETLMRYAGDLRRTLSGDVALDIGCGAARNGVPLAKAGWRVIGTDTSEPMLEAAARRFRQEDLDGRATLVRATMDALPVADRIADLVVAHGIWNLARTGVEFRAAVREAARAARPGAGLFLFTFSRHTLPDQVTPLDGETFVFTEFAGEPQCFLTAQQIVEELGAAGFTPDGIVPLHELNRPAGLLRSAAGPVIYEGTFRRD